jgi:hypothetical protein
MLGNRISLLNKPLTERLGLNRNNPKARTELNSRLDGVVTKETAFPSQDLRIVHERDGVAHDYVHARARSPFDGDRD